MRLPYCFGDGSFLPRHVLVTPKGHRRFSAATRRMADRGSKPSESANSLPARTEKRSFAPGAGVRALAYRPRFPRQPKASAGSPLVWQTFTRWSFYFRRQTTLGGWASSLQKMTLAEHDQDPKRG